MFRDKKSHTNQKTGFTLIELLVVIAIIGLLASIVLVSVSNTRMKARDAKRVSDFRQVMIALAMYFNDNGYYPSAAAANNCTTTYWDTMATALSGTTYISRVPSDPSNTGNYVYAYGTSATSNATNYALRAVMESSTVDPGKSALASDIDTSTICAAGLTCVDSANAYCVGP